MKTSEIVVQWPRQLDPTLEMVTRNETIYAGGWGVSPQAAVHEYAVTVGAHASEPERFAAAQLAHFLSLTGWSRRGTVAPSAVTPGAPLFAVGVEAAACSAGVNTVTLNDASVFGSGAYCPDKDPVTGVCWNASGYASTNTTGRTCQLKTDDAAAPVIQHRVKSGVSERSTNWPTKCWLNRSSVPCGGQQQQCGPPFSPHDGPSFHITDKSCGLNDPNGPFFDATHGIYHLFYQDHLAMNNDGVGIGPVWAHVVSRDLAHWARLGVALCECECITGTCICSPSH